MPLTRWEEHVVLEHSVGVAHSFAEPFVIHMQMEFDIGDSWSQSTAVAN